MRPSTTLLSAALLTGTAGVVVLTVPPRLGESVMGIPITEPAFTVQFLPPDGILSDPVTGTPVVKRVRIDWEALPGRFYSLDRLTEGSWVAMRQIDAGEGGLLSYSFDLCEDDTTNQWRAVVSTP